MLRGICAGNGKPPVVLLTNNDTLHKCFKIIHNLYLFFKFLLLLIFLHRVNGLLKKNNIFGITSSEPYLTEVFY